MDLPTARRPVLRRSKSHEAGPGGVAGSAGVSLGLESLLSVGNLPAPLSLWQDGGGVWGGMEVFVRFCLPWQNLDPGNGKQGRNHPGKGVCGQYQEPGTRPHLPQEQSPRPRRALVPLWPPDNALRAGGEPRTDHWGKRSQAPTWSPCLVQLCLVLKLGGSLQRGWALPKAQSCTGFSVTVGTEQAWWVQEPWLGTEWDTQAWGYPLAVPKGWGEALLLPPFRYLSPCCEKEDLIRMLVPQACLPSFSSPSRFGGTSGDQASGVWLVREESEQLESAQSACQV